MANNNDELTLQRIGMMLGKDPEYPHQDTLLLSKLARNMVSTSIFKNLGNQILYRRELLEEFDWVLLDFWGEQKGRHRWAEIEYLMRGGQFTVRYVYPDEIDDEEDPLDRRTRTVRRYFGDKPIVYPPWENDGSEFEV